jgi:hypothetical protein
LVEILKAVVHLPPVRPIRFAAQKSSPANLIGLAEKINP